MADRETMAAYAANTETYRKVVSDAGGNSMLDSFMEQLPPRARVLDFGCGVGNCAAAMQAAGHLVTCQDASPEMAAMARDLFGLEVEIMSFDKLELETAFDAVWASFSLLHIPKSDLPDILARLHRALRPGGLLYIGLKSGSSEQRDRFGRFYAYYEEEELAGHIRNAGLSPISVMHDDVVGMSGVVEPCLHITSRKPG